MLHGLGEIIRVAGRRDGKMGAPFKGVSSVAACSS